MRWTTNDNVVKMKMMISTEADEYVLKYFKAKKIDKNGLLGILCHLGVFLFLHFLEKNSIR